MTEARWARAAAPFAAALATVVVMAVVAGAHDTDVTDRDDARGKLDVREVRLAHEEGPPIWTVVTFATWGVGEMWDRGYIMVMLDTEGGEAAEHYLLVRSDRVSLEGSLWRARAFGPDSFLGSVPVTRLSGRSASVQVSLSRLSFGANRRFYRWWVHTVYTSDICRRSCHDRVPNGDTLILQWRPGMSPTPTSSSSESSAPAP